MTALKFEQDGLLPNGEKTYRLIIGGKTVRVEWTMQDTSGWILGTVYFDNSEINLEMIEDGCAWYDRRTGPAPHYTAAEKKAREAKVGLWADPAAINPMNFRRAASAR